MQITADLTGTELLGLGFFASLGKLAHPPRTDVVFHPSMRAPQADALFAGWQRAVPQVLRPTQP